MEFHRERASIQETFMVCATNGTYKKFLLPRILDRNSRRRSSLALTFSIQPMFTRAAPVKRRFVNCRGDVPIAVLPSVDRGDTVATRTLQCGMSGVRSPLWQK